MFDSAITSALVEDINEIKAKEKELKAAKRLLMEEHRIQKVEAEIKTVNECYVVGSRRKATPEEFALLKKTTVCTIVCAQCGAQRVVSAQDAKQTVLCLSCKEEADKAKTKARRAHKRLQGKTVEQLQAEIAEAQMALETMKKAVG